MTSVKKLIVKSEQETARGDEEFDWLICKSRINRIKKKFARIANIKYSGVPQRKSVDTANLVDDTLPCYLWQGHHHKGDRAARRPHILRSICYHWIVALAKDVRLLIASIHNQPMCPDTSSIDIFDNLPLVGWNLKARIFDPKDWGFMGAVEVGEGSIR